MGGGESRWGNSFSDALHPLATPPPEGSQGRLTESPQRIDEMTTVSLTFSEMHRGGVKDGTFPPLDAEVSGATSQASLSYLCQATARE